MVGKYLTNLNRNKTACAYIINNALEVFEKIQCLKLSAWIDAQPSFYTYVIECVVVSVFEFAVNETTTSSY